jgi:hypothetical protein
VHVSVSMPTFFKSLLRAGGFLGALRNLGRLAARIVERNVRINSLDLALLEALQQLFFALWAHLVREVEKGLLLLAFVASTRGQPVERGDRRRASSSLLSLTSLVACPSSHKR